MITTTVQAGLLGRGKTFAAPLPWAWDTASLPNTTIPVPLQDNASGDLVTRTITYTYDSLNRLMAADYSTGESYAYQYYAVSNREVMTETLITTTVATTYTYNAANQLMTARASNDGVIWYYTHDGRGNLVRQTPGGTESVEGETRYTYNAANQLVRVELYTSGNYITLAKSTYNVDGERVQLTTYAIGVPMTVTYGVFQGELLVADNGMQTTRYLRGQNLIAEYESEWIYHLQDGEGSVRQTADENGTITSVRAYQPFGGILEEKGQHETTFGFLGAQLDRISGLLYVGGRYYDSTTGRFLTPNRTFDPYNPRTLNPYAPWQDPVLWLLAPLAVLGAFKGKGRRKYGYWSLLLLMMSVGTSVLLTSCESDPIAPLPPTQPPTLPPSPTPSPSPSPSPMPSPSPSPTPQGWYNRQKAKDYALAWWDGPPYGYGVYQDFDPDGLGGDCTNFASQVLFEGGIRDPRSEEAADNSDLKYWHADRALLGSSFDNVASGTWNVTPFLRRFLVEELGFLELTYHNVPYVNGAEDADATNEEWIKWLETHKAQIQPGDIVFLHQPGQGVYWNHAAVIVGWGAQTFFPSGEGLPTPTPVIPGPCQGVQKPLVVEHSTGFAYSDWQPRSIDNTGGKVDEISIVHIQ